MHIEYKQNKLDGLSFINKQVKCCYFSIVNYRGIFTCGGRCYTRAYYRQLLFRMNAIFTFADYDIWIFADLCTISYLIVLMHDCQIPMVLQSFSTAVMRLGSIWWLAQTRTRRVLGADDTYVLHLYHCHKEVFAGHCSAMQSQKAVTVHVKSEQLPSFCFAR